MDYNIFQYGIICLFLQYDIYLRFENMRLLFIYIISFFTLLHTFFSAGNFANLEFESLLPKTFFCLLNNKTSQDAASSNKIGGNKAVYDLQLNYFKGEKSDNKIVLSWETEKENKSISFLIEKSLNGIAFKDLAFVSGSSKNEKNVYSYIDTCSLSGQYFYRLKQKKSDGTFSNLEILYINNTKTDKSSLLLNGETCIGKCNISKASLTELASGNKKILMLDFMGNAFPVKLPGLNKTRINIKYNPTDYFQSGVLIARSFTKAQTKIVK